MQCEILTLFKSYLEDQRNNPYLKASFSFFEIENYLFISFKCEYYPLSSIKKELFTKQKFIPLIGDLIKFDLKINEKLGLKGNLFVVAKDLLIEKSESYLLMQNKPNNDQQKREIFKGPVIIENTLGFFIDVKTQSQVVCIGNFL